MDSEKFRLDFGEGSVLAVPLRHAVDSEEKIELVVRNVRRATYLYLTPKQIKEFGRLLIKVAKKVEQADRMEK